MTDYAAKWDELTIAQLRARDTLKWSMESPVTGRPVAGAWVAESDFGPAPMVEQAVQAAIANNRTGYLHRALPKQLEVACADFQERRFNWQVDAEWVIPTPDVLSVLQAMITTLTEPRAQIIVPTPAYFPFLTIPEQLGREAVQVPSLHTRTGWQLDLEGIERACAAGAKMLILCNPWNPTGRALTVTEQRQVLEIAEKYHVYIFADEIHSPLVLPGRTHIPFLAVDPAAAALTVCATAASKAFNIPGLKSAQAIIPDADLRERMMPAFSQLHEFLVPIGMIASIAAYTEGDEWLDAELAYLQANARYVHEAVRDAGYAMDLPEATYLAWWDVRRPDGADYLRDNADVLTNAGSTMGADYVNFVRFNFGTARPILEELVPRCLEVLAEQEHA